MNLMMKSLIKGGEEKSPIKRVHGIKSMMKGKDSDI